ncbi:5,10-methylenetetrahydrofolate reductase (NAD(P)) [Dethiosulfatibacter aminovorans DSM 17477]|uniref:Methylenetetrahydrofolate reductase n=1 Tax=Dethiosulfatibacter aminovorans DSM 17477 TaxID=1121476 RepID=A0A1M6DNJ9_9FIRM|nr:methylenetetrahydrofolate reductase [NAD(P)H] [Dethiosulfatibacter aminovorans]SHI74775.1 5,10-methylenetetrahydrofolate reductase (NAD(P)) [Dethiosulfatibacter aminovorans DSM 17477]
MNIIEKFNKKDKVISFEIFPPNKTMTLKQLLDVIDELALFRPDFISVTYGASGNANSNYTIDIAQYIKEKYTIEAMPHLTCITSTKDKIDEILRSIEEKKLRNVLALRGDLPTDPNFKFPDPLHFQYASDLIKYIKSSKYDISAAAACYPEGHMDCDSLDKDIDNLCKKVEMGADFLITQLFFDNEKYYTFKDKLSKKNLSVPITMGILPVTNAKQIKRITTLSGASIPAKLDTLLKKYENDNKSMMEAGIEYACRQMEELNEFGVDGFHLYVMNKPEVAKKIFKNMNW